MAVIRILSIKNFRCIKELRWFPQMGINCLIGPGDTGKSTILDAIDYCIGAKRNLIISDTDFYNSNIHEPIQITITLGLLEDNLMELDLYGLYLRGYDASQKKIIDEPGKGVETVLTLRLVIESDLEPQWSLISKRAIELDQSRNLNWKDRLDISPARLGVYTDNHLGWKRGSILHKLSEDKIDTSTALTDISRELREKFGSQANEQLENTLSIVNSIANELGISIGSSVQAQIDSNSLSLNNGTISLHDENNIPLNKLGLGSIRMLITKLQRMISKSSSIILIDELEYGLEPHRILMLLKTLRPKENSNIQVFITTHSPVVVRELSGNELMITRRTKSSHTIIKAGNEDLIQGTIRIYAEALLSPKILVCEGASEVGLIKGVDAYYYQTNEESILSYGTTLIDGGGDSALKRALALQSLGYKVALFRDCDVKIDEEKEEEFKGNNGTIITWRDGNCLEDELFLGL